MDGNILVIALFHALIGISAIITISPLILGANASYSLHSSLLTTTLTHYNTANNNNTSNNNDDDAPADTISTTANTILLETAEAKSTCKISEWKCLNETCISLSKYCDGTYDCLDHSDEESHCSVCNRTLYGDAGKTYELEIHKPKTLPFLCHLNFTAAGGSHGDIVQINVDKFNVGRFTSHTNDGCQDGFMTITEQNFQHTGGQWCGTVWGYNVYYSESSSINITLNLLKFFQPQQGITDNFSFKLTYKFLKRTDAKLRTEKGIWTGDHVPGTYCNRNIYDCDRRVCRIRSPNFPGMYPRNITCKYHIHHRPPPNGLHAMLVIRQPIGQKMYLKEQQQERHHESSNRAIRTWNHCESVQDYLSIYDGKSSSYPELARVCGGDSLPDIISSGPDMLIEFQTSPYDSLFHPIPVSFLLGFEMQVEVIFVNANSQMFTRQPNKCEFTLNAFESTSGELDSPKHTLPSNTVCRYHFQGRRHEIVWITFLKYHSAVDQAAFEAPTECAPQLRIWDGKFRTASKPDSLLHTRNATLVAEICREEVPKLCSRMLISRDTRPCSTQESYLSTGQDMTIEYMPTPMGTNRIYGSSASFKLRYEFLDTALGGAPIERRYPATGGYKSMPEPAALLQFQSKSCDRVYRSSAASRGIFRSTSNVFMFGRGGSSNISCTIRFEANVDETVRLTITRARFGGRACQNIQNRSGRWHCNHMGGPISELRIGEIPWADIRALPRDCICGDISGSLTLAPTVANTVEVVFTTLEMHIDQDFRDFYFEGRYEFVKDSCQINWEERRLRGLSGEAVLSAMMCGGVPMIQPWLLEPESENSFLVLMMKGFWMPPLLHSVPPCPTDVRITVYSTNNPKSARDLCPSGADVVAYSDGWDSIYEFSPIEISKNLVIEFRVPWRPGTELADYKISWMEIFPDIDCPHKCTELRACIAPKLWCDGKIHCPSGQDEDPAVCDAPPPLSPLHVGLAAAALTIFLSLAAGLAACIRRRRGEKKSSQATNGDLNGLGSGMGSGSIGSGYSNHHQYHAHPQQTNIPPLYLDTQPKDNYC